MFERLLTLLGRAHAQLAHNPFATPRIPEQQQPANFTYYSSHPDEKENAA